MSSLVTRPWAPVPWTSARFTPFLGGDVAHQRAGELAEPVLDVRLARLDLPGLRGFARVALDLLILLGRGGLGRRLGAGLGRGLGRGHLGGGGGGVAAAPSRALSSRLTSVAVGCGAAPEPAAAGTAGAARGRAPG